MIPVRFTTAIAAVLLLLSAPGFEARLRTSSRKLSSDQVQNAIYDEEAIQAEIREEEEKLRLERLEIEAAEKAQREAALHEESMAEDVLREAQQQEDEISAQEYQERSEHVQAVHRSLQKELEILEDGKVLFRGKVYEGDQINFGGSEEEEPGAVMEDRPDYEDDVQMVRVQGAYDNKDKE